MKQPTTATRARDLFLFVAMIFVVCGCDGTKTARLDMQTWDCGDDGGNITSTLDGKSVTPGQTPSCTSQVGD